MGVFQAANATLIMGAVPRDRLGTGGALIAMSMSMGIVTSVALMGGVFDGRLTLHEAGNSRCFTGVRAGVPRHLPCRRSVGRSCGRRLDYLLASRPAMAHSLVPSGAEPRYL